MSDCPALGVYPLQIANWFLGGVDIERTVLVFAGGFVMWYSNSLPVLLTPLRPVTAARSPLKIPFLSLFTGMHRFGDIVIAVLGLLLLSPVLALVYIAVSCTSSGGALFRQQRVGLNGAQFAICKFRTMLAESGAEAGTFNAGDSSRVTAVGSFLRRTKLDELPQLLNVVAGDMAIVGPRPEIRRWVDAFPEEWARVHTIRPGITDPASIVYRNEEEMLASADDPIAMYRDTVLPAKLMLYKEYVETKSTWGDIVIIIKTLRALFVSNR